MPNTGTVVPPGWTRETASLLLSKLSSSPAFSTIHCTKLPSREHYQLQPCSHRPHLRWNHCPLPKKAHSHSFQASPVPPRVSNMQSFLDKYMPNFQQLIALGNQNSSPTKNIPCDSTTFLLMCSKRACDIRLGSYVVLNGCDRGWRKWVPAPVNGLMLFLLASINC